VTNNFEFIALEIGKSMRDLDFQDIYGIVDYILPKMALGWIWIILSKNELHFFGTLDPSEEKTTTCV
jgi:hypothetical protein